MSGLGSQFDDWGYVFLENDSVDNTRNLLTQFDLKHSRGVVRSIARLDAEINLRTERLASLRNRCLEEIFVSPQLSEFDYLIIMDLDAVNENIDDERVLELIDVSNPDWTAVFANQSERYYDIWALRHPTWSPDDCWKRVRERPTDMSRDDAIDVFLKQRRIKLEPERGFVEVQSAFGGFGIYKLQALHGCRYVGIDDKGEEICEHVSFHKDLTDKGAKLYIDATLINGRGNHRHNAGMALMTKAKRKVQKLMKR